MPGKKSNYKKNYSTRKEWMDNKKIGRPKQIWEIDPDGIGYWKHIGLDSESTQGN